MRSNERFGILPIPEAIRVLVGLLEFHSDFGTKKKIKHVYKTPTYSHCSSTSSYEGRTVAILVFGLRNT